MKFTIFLYAATLFFFLDDISAQRQPLRPETTIEVTSKRPLSRGRAKFSATPEYKEASDDIQNVKKTRKNPESFEYNPSREERPNERKVITETKFEARNAPPKSFLFEPSSTTPEESPEELLKNFGPNSDKFLVPSKQQTEETLLKLDIPVERVRSTEAPKEVPSPIVSLSSSTPSLSSPLPSSLENEKENSSEGKDIVKNVSESNEEISVETLKTPLLFQETPSSTKRAEVASSTPSIQKSIFDAKQAQNVRAQATRIQGRGRASNANTTPKQNTVTAAPSRRQRTRPTRPPHSSTTTSTEKSQANFRRGSRRRGETTTIPSREKKDIHERNFSILDLINPEEQTEKIRAGRKIRAESREEDLASNPRRRVESRRRAPTPPSNLNANEVTPKPVSRRGHARRLESNEKITSQENKRVDVSRRQEIKKETAERKVSSETPRRGSHRSNQEQVKVTTEESPRQRQPVRTRGGRKQEVTASVPSGSGNEIPPRRRNQPVRNSQETRTEVRGRSSSRGSPRASPTEKSAPSRTVIRKRVESKKVAENSPERITVDLTTAKAVENEITTRKIEEETAKNTQNAELLKHKLDAEIQASTENTKNEASNEQIKKIEEDIVKQAAEANLLEKALEENLEQKVETRNSRITSRGSNRGKAEQEPIKASGRESVRRSPASRSREIKKENNEPRSVSGRDARRNTSRQTNSVRTTVNNNSPKTPSSSDDVNKKEIVRGNRSKSKFNPLEYDANKVEEEPFAGGKKLTTRTTRRTIGRGRGRPKFDDLEAATTDQVKISVQRVEAPSTTPSTAKFNTVSVEVGAPPSVTRVEERSSVAKTTPTPRTTVKESVQVSQVTEVVSKKKIGRKTLRKKIVSTPSPKSAVTVSVKVDEPIVTVSQVITRGTKKAAVENKKGSSEEIDESDNYPEPFKALIKAKEKQEKNHKESSRPTAKPSSLLGKKISKTVTSTSSSPPKTESFTTRSSTSTTSTSTTTTTQKNTIEADNEVVENNKGRKPFPTRRRFSLSTKKPLKKGGEETTKPPRTTTTKRTGALPTRAKLLQKYQDKGNKQKFHARFNSVSEDKPEESSVKPSGFIPKPTRSYKKATPRSVQETVVHSTQVPVSALSAKKSSRYSSRYRSDTSSRSSPARTTSIPAYIPTVPTVTPSNAVRGVHTEDNPAEGLHIISFDDPVNSISSDSLINGEYLSPAHKAKSGSISLSGQLNVAQYLPGIPNQNAVTFVPGSTPKSMPVPKVQDKPSSIIETIINSISSIPTTTSSDKLTTVTNAAPTQGSAILKLVRDDADIVDAFTTEKPTTIIERILSSLSAIQADGGAKNSLPASSTAAITTENAPTTPAGTTQKANTESSTTAVISIQELLARLSSSTKSPASNLITTQIPTTVRYTTTPTTTTTSSAPSTVEDSFASSTIPTLHSKFEVSPNSVVIYSANDISSTLTPDDDLFGTTVSILGRGFAGTTPNFQSSTLIPTTIKSNTDIPNTTLQPSTPTPTTTQKSDNTIASTTMPNVSDDTNMSTDMSSSSDAEVSTTAIPVTTDNANVSDMVEVTTVSNVDVSGATSTDAKTNETMTNTTTTSMTNSDRSGRLLSVDPDDVSNDLSPPSSSPKPTPDYFIFAVLPNNTILRKRPPSFPTKETPFLIVGVYPNNTVVHKFPNGTVVPEEPVVQVESQNDIAPPEIPRFVASTTTVSTSSSPTTISTVNNPTTTSAPSAPTTISTINNPTTTNAPSAPTTISTDNNPTTTNAPSAPTTISTANNPTTINIISSPTTMEATTIVSTSGSLSSSTTVDTPTIVSTSGSLSSSTTVDTPTTPNSPVTTTGAPTTIASSTLGTITTGLPPTSTNAPPTNSPTIPTLTGILGGNTIKEFNSLLDKTRDREEVTVKPSVQTDTVDIEANTISGSIGTPEKVVELAARFGETSTTSAATTNTPVISTMTTPKPTTKATSTEKVSVVYPSTFLPNFITTFLSTLRPQGTTFGSTTGARTIVPTTTESFVNSPTTVKIPLTTVPVTTEAPKMTTPSTEPPMSTTPPPMTLPPTTMRLSTLQGGSVTATTEKRQTTTFSEIANTIISNFRGRIRFGDETTTVVVPTTKSIVTTIQPTENIIYTTSRSSSTTKRSIEQFNSPVYNAIPTVPPRTTTQKPTVQDTVVPSTVTVPSTTESLDEKVARLKNKKDLTEEQKENLRILMELENEQKALLKQLSFLTNFNLRGGANQNIPNLFGLAQEREETTVVPTTVPTTIRTTIRTVPTTTTPEPTTTTTTTTTTPPPTTTTSLKPDTTTISIEDLLAALGTRQPKFLGYPTNQPAVEDLLKQINANGLDKVTSSYGKSTDALLASLLKEQGIVPTTPKNLETLQLLIEAGTTTTTTTTRKPRPRTTPPPRPGRLMQGLNWLLNALVPPVDTTRPPRPRPVPTTTIRPTTVTTEEEELLSRAPTHISPVVAETVTTPSNSLGGLSQSEIQKLIAQLEAVQRDPKKLQTLDLTPLKNLQVNQKAKDVQVTNSGATGASGRLTERPSSIKLESAEPPYIRGRVAKATTPSGTESANSIRNEEKDTTLKPKVTLPPVKLRPVPGVPEEGGQVRSQLFNAAVNVTKAISSFLGSAIQDAVEQLKSMYGSAEVDAVLGIEPNTTQTP